MDKTPEPLEMPQPQENGPPPLKDLDPELSLKIKSPVPWLVLGAIPIGVWALMSLAPEPPALAPAQTLEQAQQKLSPKQEWKARLDAQKAAGIIPMRGTPAAPEITTQNQQANVSPSSMGEDAPAAQEAVPVMEEPPCDFAPWVGLPISEDILMAVRESKRPYRVLPPGAPATMDYSPARINFEVDKDKIIIAITCG